MRRISFRFRGRFETHGDEVWALCEHAPVFVSGESEEAALREMAEAVADYLHVLFERQEVGEAVAAGLLVEVKGERGVPWARREGEGRFVATVAHVA